METIEDLIYHLKRMVNEDTKIDRWKEPTVVSDFRFRKSEVENIITLLERSDNNDQYEHYQKCVNDIDDFLEYKYMEYTGQHIRDKILSIIDNLNKKL